MKRVFLSLGLLLSVSLATVVFNACEGDDNSGKEQTEPDDSALTSDVGVVINGVKWATRNVDAPGTFAAKPEDAGMFYQWNRKIGWSATDPMINSNDEIDWDDTIPTGDAWEKANDPSPAGWRVPTLDEIKKLLDTENVTQVWTTENSKNGYRFIDKQSEKSIFLPAVGYRYYYHGRLYRAGSHGYYWSSMVNDGSNYDAYGLRFDSDDAYWLLWYRRGDGRLLRAVAE